MLFSKGVKSCVIFVLLSITPQVYFISCIVFIFIFVFRLLINFIYNLKILRDVWSWIVRWLFMSQWEVSVYCISLLQYPFFISCFLFLPKDIFFYFYKTTDRSLVFCTWMILEVWYTFVYNVESNIITHFLSPVIAMNNSMKPNMVFCIWRPPRPSFL